MLFQPSNISPSTLSGIGAGTVDVTQGLTVSWQVNGDTPMTDYQITVYQNDTASTQKYTTGKISLSTPFQTHDKNGNPQFFSTQISAANLSAAGIVNGYANGYKILITQWWGAGANDYVTQTSASVFNTLANPTLTINTISGTSISETITANYSQAQGDPISTVEWIFAVAGNESLPIKQTGTVTTQILEFDVDGLMNGATYSIECNVVTAGGVYISTGFIQFTVSYSITSEQIDTTLGKINGSNGVYLSWSPMSSNSINWYDVYRMEAGSYFLKKVATVASNLREVVDYSAGSNQTVQYIIIGLNGTTPVSSAQTSPVTPIFWDYSILLCHTDNDGVYHVDSEYRFGLNVETGNISNNNEPTFQINFTKYPNRQPISTLYKTGTLKSYIGKAGGQGQYTDSLALQDAIFRVSTSTLKKFLKTRKGDVLMVETSSSIDMKTLDGSPLQPMYATINWAEVGDASNISIVSEPSDEFFPIVTSYEYSDPITASIVRFTSNKGGLPFKEVKVNMAPIQDLNGYDSPWSAGGGVSKCPSFANGTHTTTNGLTVTIQDGEITINGTASGSGHYTEDIESTVMPADAYVSFNNPVGTFNIAYVFINGNTQVAAPSLSPANGTKQPTGLSGATVNKLRIFCNAGTYDNFKMSPIVHDGSTPQAWQPYANICPISGRTVANVYRTGKNILGDVYAANTLYSVTGEPSSNSNYDSYRVFAIQNQPITISGVPADSNWIIRVLLFDESMNFVSSLVNATSQGQTVTPTISGWAIICFRKSATNKQAEYGSSATSYESYSGNTYAVDWTSTAGTVYGGTVDVVTGQLTVDMASVDLGTLTWYTSTAAGYTRFWTSIVGIAHISAPNIVAPILCSEYKTETANHTYAGIQGISLQHNADSVYVYDAQRESMSTADFKAAMSGVQLCYELATPLTYNLTAQEVTTLVGENNVWSDSGDVTVIYTVAEKKTVKAQ